jgi:putative flavoprotein involved in K+ transport
VGGISTTHPGLVYVGLEFQRSFSSNTLRGVSRDADDVIAPLAAYAGGAISALGR